MVKAQQLPGGSALRWLRLLRLFAMWTPTAAVTAATQATQMAWRSASVYNLPALYISPPLWGEIVGAVQKSPHKIRCEAAKIL